MRIFNGHLDGLSILSCCTLLEDQPTPSTKTEFNGQTISQQIKHPANDNIIKIERHQPRPIPAPSPQPRRRSVAKDKDKEWLTRTKSFVSFVSAHRSISGLRDLDSDRFSRSSHLPSSPTSTLPSPTSTIFHQIKNDPPTVTNPVFQPLYLRFSKSENEWESGITQVYNQISPETLSYERKSLKTVDDLNTMKNVITNSENVAVDPNQSDMSLKFDNIPSQASQPKFSSHVRNHSEPATFERIKLALDESYKLSQRLKDLEDDIERKSVYLGSRPSSPVSRKEENFPEVPELPHPLKSAPTHPFKRPTGRSLSLSSCNVRPDWGTPLPPLPLVLQSSLTKKEKTISRVSSWLISSNQHDTIRTSKSITNMPRPVTDREGFYQCLWPSQLTTGGSTSTSDCFSDQPTVLTSNYSSPAIKTDFSSFLAEDYNQRRKSLEDIVKNSNLSTDSFLNRSASEEIDTGIAY